MKANTTEEQRENISDTRHRMDETIDALASRLNGRHLVDEVLGYFRSNRGSSDGSGHHLQEQVSDSAGKMVRAVVDTVREHPLPAALIGSGIAWMLYERTRSDSLDYAEADLYSEDYADPQEMLFDEDYYAAGKFGSEDEQSRMERLKDDAGGRIAAMRHRVGDLGEKAHHLRHRMGTAQHAGKRGAQRARRRAMQAGDRVRHGARDVYTQGRAQLDRHPLEAGLISLAGGLIAGLLTPNPTRLNEMAGPTARNMQDKVSRRADEVMQRGRRVASAAVETAQHEASEQGLTPEALKRGAGAVVDETRRAAQDTAQGEAKEQGLTPHALKEKAKAVARETKESAQESAKHESDEMQGEMSSSASRNTDRSV